MDSKWDMFRNFMYNEIGITKEDIRMWIREVVREESVKLTNQTFGTWSVKDLISKEIVKEINSCFNTGIREQICTEIGKMVLDKVLKDEYTREQ